MGDRIQGISEHGCGNEIRKAAEKSYLCSCGCHKKGSKVMHVAPCCEKCKICNQHIQFNHMEEHLKECHSNFVIDKGLADALNHDTKWQAAFDAAKMEYCGLLLLVSDIKELNISKFTCDFIKKCGSKNKSDFSGRVSIREIYDESAVLLEVEFKQSAEVKCLEIIFNEIGIVLHAAIV